MHSKVSCRYILRTGSIVFQAQRAHSMICKVLSKWLACTTGWVTWLLNLFFHQCVLITLAHPGKKKKMFPKGKGSQEIAEGSHLRPARLLRKYGS